MSIAKVLAKVTSNECPWSPAKKVAAPKKTVTKLAAAPKAPAKKVAPAKKITTVSGIDVNTYSVEKMNTINSFDKMLDALVKESPDFSIFVDDEKFLPLCNEVGCGECRLGMELLLALTIKGIPQRFYNGMSKIEKERNSIAVDCHEILVNEIGMAEYFAIDVLYILAVKMKFEFSAEELINGNF